MKNSISLLFECAFPDDLCFIHFFHMFSDWLISSFVKSFFISFTMFSTQVFIFLICERLLIPQFFSHHMLQIFFTELIYCFNFFQKGSISSATSVCIGTTAVRAVPSNSHHSILRISVFRGEAFTEICRQYHHL